MQNFHAPGSLRQVSHLLENGDFGFTGIIPTYFLQHYLRGTIINIITMGTFDFWEVCAGQNQMYTRMAQRKHGKQKPDMELEWVCFHD